MEGQGGGQDWGHTTGPRVTHSTAWCPNKNRDLTNKHGNLKKKMRGLMGRIADLWDLSGFLASITRVYDTYIELVHGGSEPSQAMAVQRCKRWILLDVDSILTDIPEIIIMKVSP